VAGRSRAHVQGSGVGGDVACLQRGYWDVTWRARVNVARVVGGVVLHRVVLVFEDAGWAVTSRGMRGRG